MPKAVTEHLRTKQLQPTRIAIFLRTKSPLYNHAYNEVIQRACSALDIPYNKTRFIAINIWQRLTILVFDIYHIKYDVSTAHRQADLPVLLVDYGRKRSYSRVASPEFRNTVNRHVARQHNLHGWDARPPYLQDQTLDHPPSYRYPRDPSIM